MLELGNSAPTVCRGFFMEYNYPAYDRLLVKICAPGAHSLFHLTPRRCHCVARVLDVHVAPCSLSGNQLK